MVDTLAAFIRIPAIGPENGGEGEHAKATELVKLLETIGVDKIEHYDADDERVPTRKRPNVVAYAYGEDPDETLWIVSHLDIVPPGENSLWTITKPFEPLVKEDRIYGRGSEDNMQSAVASIFAVKALRSLGIKPKRTVALAFVADEEHGSKYGIQHLINQKLFKKEDLIIVPDGGKADGSFIEIAEKSALWFRIRTVGKQAHASRPGTGLNAHRIGMNFALALDRMLHEEFSDKDSYFDPPESTFEPTMKAKNVDAVNIIPGEDIVHFDCRLLPSYSVEEVEGKIEELATAFGKKTGAQILIEPVQKSVAPKPTDAKAEVVTMLETAIRNVRGITPRIGGIGGGTCAAFFRKAEMPAVVWCTHDETAHQPNEYARIGNMIGDAKVFAFMATM